MKNYINLIRYKNISFILLIQILTYWCIINPILLLFGIQESLPLFVKILSIVATLFISAGGYVINDYFDIKIDLINKPDRVIITNGISKKSAMNYYTILTSIGVLCGLICAFILRSITIGLIFVITPGALWFYSTTYKRQLIIGNLIVAVCSALVLLLPLICESTFLLNYYSMIKETPIIKMLYTWVCSFAGFAFTFTLIREIVKDLEDIPGDREMECHTIPVVWGETVSKILITILLLCVNIILSLITIKYIPFEGTLSLKYYIIGIATPSIFAIVSLWGNNCTAYKTTSYILKFIMLIGILYSFVFYYLISASYKIPFLGIFQII